MNFSVPGAGKTAVGWLTGTTAAAAGWVASAGLLASAVGEGGGQRVADERPHDLER